MTRASGQSAVGVSLFSVGDLPVLVVLAVQLLSSRRSYFLSVANLFCESTTLL